jgi:copper chaperone NosL
MKNSQIALLLFMLIGFASCKAEFDPVDYGHDACTHCKMTIVDKRYAAEILTAKGKAYKFDDITCLRKYMAENKMSREGLVIFVADYSHPGDKFLDAEDGVYLHSDIFKSPMNGCYAAFEKVENAWSLKDSLNTDVLKWENLN